MDETCPLCTGKKEGGAARHPRAAPRSPRPRTRSLPSTRPRGSLRARPRAARAAARCWTGLARRRLLPPQLHARAHAARADAAGLHAAATGLRTRTCQGSGGLQRATRRTHPATTYRRSPRPYRPRTWKGTRRVQLVRRDGRDVSTLYGREGGEGNPEAHSSPRASGRSSSCPSRLLRAPRQQRQRQKN
jgi:hypothetical protein